MRGSNVGCPGATPGPPARNSHLHRRPRLLTLGPSAWAMAHCTLISRSIRKHDNRLGGQACCKQHASPTRLWDEAHPTVSRSHHSLRPPRTMQDAMVHPVGTHPHKGPHLVLYVLVARRVCMCEVCRPSPHCGVGCGACCTGPTCLLAMVVFESFDRGQRTALTPPPSPNATLRVANAFSSKCQVEG